MRILNSGVWLGWAELENEINGAGSYEKENNALWIYKVACVEREIPDSSTWIGWAKFVKYNALCSQEWTVDKIYQRVLEITNEKEDLVYAYARFLMDEGRFEESRYMIRKLYSIKNKHYLILILFVEMIAGNHDLNSEFCVEKLARIAEANEPHNFGVQYALYVYYRFQKNEELAKKYYSMLDIQNENNSHYAESLEKFLITSQNAFGSK